MTAPEKLEEPVGALDHAEQLQTARLLGELNASVGGLKTTGEDTLREVREVRTAQLAYATKLANVEGMATDALRRVGILEAKDDRGRLTWQKVLGYGVALVTIVGGGTAALITLSSLVDALSKISGR